MGPDLRLITDKQLSTFIKETEDDFPWFPSTKSNEEIENDPDQESVASYDGIRPWESLATPERELLSPAPLDDSNPGFNLFESDSDDENGTWADNIVLPPSDNEQDPIEDQTPSIHNIVIQPLAPNRGHLDPTSNWLQSSSENESDPDYDQFLLNTNDTYSDDAWSSCSEIRDNGLSQDGFDINDSYIDDDLLANNANIRLAESSQEVHSPSELDNYFLDPEGLNLIDPFIVNQPSTDEDMINDGDPEPDRGPFDPG